MTAEGGPPPVVGAPRLWNVDVSRRSAARRSDDARDAARRRGGRAAGREVGSGRWLPAATALRRRAEWRGGRQR